MKMWRVSRYADDSAIPAADAPEENVAELPLDESCEEIEFFPVSRDKKRMRRRDYKLLSGELTCTLDRPATEEEIDRLTNVSKKLKAEGHTGVHGIGEVDESRIQRSTVRVHGPVEGAIAHVMRAADKDLSTALEKAKTMRGGVPYGSRSWLMWNSAVYIMKELLERGEDVKFEELE